MQNSRGVAPGWCCLSAPAVANPRQAVVTISTHRINQKNELPHCTGTVPLTGMPPIAPVTVSDVTPVA